MVGFLIFYHYIPSGNNITQPAPVIIAGLIFGPLFGGATLMWTGWLRSHGPLTDDQARQSRGYFFFVLIIFVKTLINALNISYQRRMTGRDNT